MLTKKNQVSRKFREIRGKRSYAKMASCLSSECKVTAGRLYDYEHENVELPLSLLIAFKTVEGAAADEILFDRNIEIVNEFNDRYKMVDRNARKREEFIDKCWEIADAAREELFGCDEPDDEDPDSMIYPYAHRFKEIREHHGKSADEVAQMVGYHRSAIYRNEISVKGKAPKLRYLFNFCNCMEVSADYILFGEFLGLCNHSSTILYGLPYGMQINLLNKFIEISADFVE